ncbi:hypothetical protein [Xanthomonas sp. SHU 199]|uniref:hypothetical protein n=1 Tax=Xanthomonas sp. SHU 199 TaxID=1591174 RepID=UPI0003662FAE|nr:hypothetical protein [Xanthomonas sp. SHU 199]
MALAHAYHPHCGCASCNRQERAAALADQRADELTLDLHRSGPVFAEALGELSDEQCTLIAGHLADGNDAGAAEILRTLVSDYIESEIVRRSDDVGASRLEAVQRMLTVYDVKPRTAPAKPWQVAA